MLICILGMGWGSAFFFNEILLREIGPLSVSLTRVGLAALTGWVYVVLTGQNVRFSMAELPALVVFGLLMFALPLAIFPLGQQYVASGVAGIVNALTPVMTVVISHLWPGGERATPLKLVGVGFGFAGIVFLTIPALGSSADNTLFGTLIMLIGPLSYACALNIARGLSKMSMSVATTWAFTFGALALAPLVLVVEGVPQTVTWPTWVSGFIVGVILTGIAFIAVFEIMRRAGPTKTSTVTFIAPISALLLGWAILGEDLGLLHFAGMAMIFLGLLAIDGRLAKWIKLN